MANRDNVQATYRAVISRTALPLTVRERIIMKDTSDAVKLDTATKVEPVVIENIKNWAVLDVHNEKSDNPDYQNIVIVDEQEQKYVTGSNAFSRAFFDIVDELADAGEENTGFSIKVYRKASKNYSGKEFITCSMV